MKKHLTLFSILLFISVFTFAQSQLQPQKKQLSSEVYASWNNISNYEISNNGEWVTYQTKGEKTDGNLYLYNVITQVTRSIPRGVKANFSPNSDFLVFQIEPQYDTLRKLKLAKTAKDKLPNDTLGIWLLEKDSIIKIANAEKYKLADHNASWIAYIDKSKTPKAKAQDEKKGWFIFKKKKTEPQKKEIKQEGDNIVLIQPILNKNYKFEFADEYLFNYEGNVFVILTTTKLDSSENTIIQYFDLNKEDSKTIFDQEGSASKLALSRSGNDAAFLFAQDTLKKNKTYDLYLWNNNGEKAKLIADTATLKMVNSWSPSINYSPNFSKDASKLYFGTTRKPVQDKKDTLLSEEKYHVDIWNYQDKQLQPQQKLQVRREQNRTYLAIYDIQNNEMQQLADTNLRSVRVTEEGQSHFALGIDGQKYGKEQTWDGWYSDYYAINIHDGSRDLMLEHHQGAIEISPKGNYIIYFKSEDKNWYSYDIEARRHYNLTKDINVKFYNELHDMPNEPNAYGIAGWYKNDAFVVIYDRYDLWRIDPTGKSGPVNITGSYGRENKIKFREITFNPEDHQYFDEENPHYLHAFNESDKSSGYFTIDLLGNAIPNQLLVSAHHYYYPKKAKNSNAVIFRRSSFTEYPDLLISDIQFNHPTKISNTNPQQSEYLWGTVELINWKAYDGQNLEGLLYKPEDFDSTQQYPVIIYFYERNADELHRHYIPKPSHSVINFSEYVSNGYIVFVPDITYKTGHPAKSAYNAIVSGAEFLKKNKWVDPKHIGIQGQSWGGYQVAMLVTMTDIFACAEAGAPVTNMTSAYGGIRWGSGMGRAFQYEKTQSRIGATLWDSLDLYIENSPLFGAPKVNTPLLIMHNDGDGAVPWYQGIEYFCALRRLDKPVWMLTYNDDDHNLMKWPNRVDLSIRMMQFFDYYLKGQPIPKWMSEGIPAIKKGKIDAYDF